MDGVQFKPFNCKILIKVKNPIKILSHQYISITLCRSHPSITAKKMVIILAKSKNQSEASRNMLLLTAGISEVTILAVVGFI